MKLKQLLPILIVTFLSSCQQVEKKTDSKPIPSKEPIQEEKVATQALKVDQKKEAVKAPQQDPETIIEPTIYKVDDFDGANDREKINNALSTLSKISGPKQLLFSTRDYIIEPTELETFDPVIGASNLHDTEILGKGATIVAKNALDCQKGYFFRINEFKNVSVKDLQFRHEPLPFIQGRILEADQKNNKVTVQLDKEFSHIRKLTQTPLSKFWCRVGQEMNSLLPKHGIPSWMGVKTDPGLEIARKAKGSGIYEIQAGKFDLNQVISTLLPFHLAKT